MPKSAEVVNKQSQSKSNVVKNITETGKSLPSSTNSEALTNYDIAPPESSEVAQKKSAPYWSHQSNSAESKSNKNKTAQRVAEEPNKTGLPDNIKAGTEYLSGMSLSDVKVHYNSNKPTQLAAHAYAQGTDIHVAPGQEKHVAHEAWHVVQQKQGRVNATTQMKATTPVNDDAGLESEADRMGAKSASIGTSIQAKAQLKKNELNNATQPAQKVKTETESVVGSEENNLTLNEDGGTISIMGYQVAVKSAKGSTSVEVAMPEMSFPASGEPWGPKIEIPIPVDPTGLAAVNVGIGLSGSVKVKPSFKAIREKTETSTIYKISGTAGFEGSVNIEATAGASVGTWLIAKAQAGVFAQGGIDMKDSNVSITGTYEKLTNGKAGNIQGDLDVNLKGELVASVGGFLEAEALMGLVKRTKKYTLGKWNLGEVDKHWKTSISSKGFGMPSFKDLYKKTETPPAIKKVDEKEETKAK